METFTFGPGATFTWGGQKATITCIKDDGIEYKVKIATKNTETISFDELMDEIRTGDICFDDTDKKDALCAIRCYIHKTQFDKSKQEYDSALSEKDKAIEEKNKEIEVIKGEKEKTLADATEEETPLEKKDGGILWNVTFSKSGIVKEIRNQFGKLAQEVKVGEKIYRRNKISKTYNSVDENELLRKEDVEKIQLLKKGGSMAKGGEINLDTIRIIYNIFKKDSGKISEKTYDNAKEKTGLDREIIHKVVEGYYDDLTPEEIFEYKFKEEKVLRKAHEIKYGKKSSNGSIARGGEINELADSHIFQNQTALVNKLIDNGIIEDDDIKYSFTFSIDDEQGITELTYEQLEEYKKGLETELESVSSEEEKNKLQKKLAQLEEIEALPREIFEWHLVSPWLAEQLLKQSQTVIMNEYGNWWGRTTTGMNYENDSVLKEIAKESYEKGGEAGYQGYKNYQTWSVKLWIDNDKGLYDYWNERATEIAKGTEPKITLAKELKEFFEENNPLSDQSNVYSDLLGNTLKEVNYHEIAEELLEEKMEKGGFIDKPILEMEKGGKVDITKNFYRFRQHSPKGVTRCAMPEWAGKVAESVKKGAKIVTCEKDGQWLIQSVLIPKEGVNLKDARRHSKEIMDKFDRKKKALGGVAETADCEKIDITIKALKDSIAHTTDEKQKQKFQEMINDLQ